MSNLFILFFIHGFFTIIAQITIIRELIVAFYGNELFSGIVLAIWFLSASLGSLLALKFKKFKSFKFLFFIQLFLFLFFPLEVFLIRYLVARTVFLGQIPSLFSSLLIVFLLLFPFCFVLNAFFAWLSNFLIYKFKNNKNFKKVKNSWIINRAYLLETVGMIAGGLFFNFFLITSSFPFSNSLNKKILKYRFPNLVESVNSLYGNIMVTKIRTQYNFYESGQLIGSNQEVELNEYLVHLILNQHPNPKRILLVGGGMNGFIFEVLKYNPVEKIDYLEIDPQLVEVSKKYLPDNLRKALDDDRVNINLVDGRRFLKQTDSKYDLVVFNLSNPSTALINRYYTKEAYQLVKKVLSRSGIFATQIHVPIDYLSQEAKNLVSLINQTIKNSFKYQLLLPEDSSILFLASNENVLITEPDLIKQRFLDRDIKTKFFSADYIEYRLTSFKINEINNFLDKEKTDKLNTDFHPLAYFSESAFWQTVFSFKLASFFNYLAFIDFKIIIVLLVLFLFLLIKKTKKVTSLSFLQISFSSFTLISFEILIIYLFQTSLGYVFSKIALIFAFILGCLGIGNYFFSKLENNKKKLIVVLRYIIIFILIYCFIFLFIVQDYPFELVFYVLVGLIGLLIGGVFPILNKYLFLADKDLEKKTGFLYSGDLLGAFIGAILPTIFFIPVYGVSNTIYLIVIINLFSLFLLQKLGQ